MPKSFTEFSSDDWRRLRPLTQAIKLFRYRLIDRSYRRQRPRAGDVAAIARSIRGRQVLVTIAFADPTLILWQTRLVRHYVPHARHVIVDNSPSDADAAQIRRIVSANDYLRAPQNPWSGRAASRSHGLALNWAWDNLIHPGQPEAFGFIDHDIFPMAADDPFAPLTHQDVFGVVRTVPPRWFLWAGFCIFRFAALRHKSLDFGQDWFVGLDTGGGNWGPLYSGIDRAKLREAPTRFFPFKPDIAIAEGPLQHCGTWLHGVGLMGNPALLAERRAAVALTLRPHLEAAGNPVLIDAA